MILVLLRPRLLSTLKRWGASQTNSGGFGREFVVLFFSLTVAYAIYRGTYSALNSLLYNQNVISVFPTEPLSVLLMILFFLLLFSALAASLGTFFYAKDLEFLLQAPIPKISFFFARNFEVLFHSAWMAVIFIAPVILAFGHAYHAPLSFYVWSAILLLLFFQVPIFLATSLVLIFGHFFSAKRAREVLILLFAILLVVILNLLRLFALPQTPKGSIASTHAFSALTRSHLSELTWSPSHWVATGIADMLYGSMSTLFVTGIALIGLLLTLSAVTFLLFKYLYIDAHSSAQAIRITHQRHSIVSSDHLRLLSLVFPAQVRALFAKEFRLFARDLTQAVQLILLIGLCIIYLYNFKILDAVEDVPTSGLLWWKALLVLSNIVMGSFVTTAVAARFVFPTISLEGKNFWILQTAPIKLSSIVKTKFWFWFLPLGIISSVIILSGALAIQAEPQIVATSALCALIISFGIVGLGVGLGSAFAHFDWDYSAQLTSNIGNLLFMISAAIYIFLSIIPVATLILLRTLKTLGVEFSPLQWYGAVTICSFLFVYFSYLVRRFSLKLGLQVLEKERLKFANLPTEEPSSFPKEGDSH